jgi:FecR protein
MHPMKPIEVEPLSEQRWAKIEKGLFDRLDREAPLAPEAPPAPRPARNVWKPAAALVLAGALAAGVGAFASKSLFETPSAAPSRIVTTTSDSRVTVGESEVDVSPESAVVVSGDDAHGVLVVVDRGKVDCEVAPRKGRPPFVVQAGDVRVKVIGTHFSVERAADGAHVAVTHGVVEVTARGQTASVHAGEAWPTDAQTIPAAVPAPVPVPVPVPVPEPPALGTRDDRAPPTAPPRRTRHPHTRRDVASRGSTSSPDRPPTTAPDSSPAIAAAPAAPPAPPAAAPPPPSAPPAPPPPSAQELYESANRMESSNPDAALATYRKLAAGSGPWAANALYAAGRLQADRGRRADATRILEAYLARFPNGANARDARDLLARYKTQ